MKIKEELFPGTDISQVCFHCGDNCRTNTVTYKDRQFCCEGCRLVYELLEENNLCNYYDLNKTPGSSRGKITPPGRFAFLDQEAASQKFIRYNDSENISLLFFLPSIHCSSCIWLLENLHRLDKGIVRSEVNFMKKEALIVIRKHEIKISRVAELLSDIGYEPLITLEGNEQKISDPAHKTRILKIGLAGFCFGNIMMFSFPEYFSLGNFFELKSLPAFLSYINLALSLPVIFYSASGFFSSAVKSIRHGYLNIDAPIALAVLVTFLRSVYEIISRTGAGYLDSMSGIVFFMLVGRYFQDKTHESLSFERDYKSYFPLGVSVIAFDGNESRQLATTLKAGDRIMVRNNEVIPADSKLLSRRTHIDNSFITGESVAIVKQAGQVVYAGGRQIGGAAEFEVIKPVSQSYLTQLWNMDSSGASSGKKENSVDRINRYFTLAVFSIAFVSALYWWYEDPAKIADAFTAVLIVACPCGLLLTSTFANGNIMRILGRNKLYLKNASVIEKLARADTVVFDKTGTLTNGSEVSYVGASLSVSEMLAVCSVASQSSHPLSSKIHAKFTLGKVLGVDDFQEVAGNGIRGYANNKYVIMGSEYFVLGTRTGNKAESTRVFVMIDGEVRGFFRFENVFRSGLDRLVSELSSDHHLKVLSGDNDAERRRIEALFAGKAEMLFDQKPEDKKNCIQSLQQQGHGVIMIGDGLNDAIALKQSEVGIAVSDDTNNFSPACDAILDGSSFVFLPAFIKLARASGRIITFTFLVSLLYNTIGLYYAVQGMLSPVIAAILMPASSISILLLATVSTGVAARVCQLGKISQHH